nr:extracellular solute-binding protein [uncultured Aminipila sp.]
MKKWIVVLCIVTLGFSVTGCGQEEDASLKQLLSEKLSGEITVSCYDTMQYKDFLENAAKTFEKENPGTKIKVESFAPMPEVKTMEDGSVMTSTVDDEQKRADYISKINTELMSGKGADVLAMDVLPYYKYADGGQLENLQSYMDADSNFDIQDYKKNILDAMKYHNGLYIIPLDYTFDYLTYDTSLFNENEKQSLQKGSKYTYNQLIEAGIEPFQRANANVDEPIRMFEKIADYGMLKELMFLNYDKYIDMENKKVNFNDGSFVKLLETVTKYGKNGYLSPQIDYNNFSMEDYQKMKQQKAFYRTKDNLFLLNEAFKSIGADSASPFKNIDTGAGDESHDKILGLVANKNGDVNFKYMQAYGINANSENKALAWAFIKYIMSDGVPMADYSLPVNNSARMKKAKIDIMGLTFSNNTMDQSKELTAEQKKIYDVYTKSIEKFSDALSYYPIKDETINNMINKEVDCYFDGSKTAEQVASTLQEKIELYLNE